MQKKILHCFLLLSLTCLMAGCGGDSGEGQNPSEAEAVADEESIDEASERADEGTDGETESEAEEVVDPDAESIASVRESFLDEAEGIREREFDNIDFSGTYFSFPDVERICALEYDNMITDFTWTAREAYDELSQCVDSLFPGLYTDEQKKEKIQFTNVMFPDGFTGNAWEYFPTLEQYEEGQYELKRGEAPAPIIANQDCFVEMANGWLRGFDRGELPRRENYQRTFDRFDALEAYPIEYRTLNVESDRTVHLDGGDISIADAARSAEEALSKIALTNRKDLPTDLSVESASVLDLGDGTNALCFRVAVRYEGMGFNGMEFDESTFSWEETSNSTHETDTSGSAIMLREGEIERLRLVSPFLWSDMEETKSYDVSISVTKAAEIASEYLTAGMKFQALGVSAVYKPISAKDQNMYFGEDEEYDHRHVTVRPCWRFALQTVSGGYNSIYYVYVDMVTGKPYTQVQKIESEIAYE